LTWYILVQIFLVSFLVFSPFETELPSLPSITTHFDLRDLRIQYCCISWQEGGEQMRDTIFRKCLRAQQKIQFAVPAPGRRPLLTSWGPRSPVELLCTTE
jgi:hypothetical protein